jgi:twitching motility protein PilT
VIDMFPPDQQSQARGALASSLRAVVAQRLLRRADGKGRIAAVEVLFGTPAVSALIRERKQHQIPSVIQTSRREGMQLLDDSLRDLVRAGVVAADEAQRFASARLRPGPGGAAEPDPEPASAPAPDRPAAAAPEPRAARR